MIGTKKGAVAIYTILEAVEGKEGVAEAEQAFNAVIELVAAPFDAAQSSADDPTAEATPPHPIGDAGGHLCVKKIIQQNSSFAPRLLERVSDDQLRSWAGCNRGCYVLLALTERENEDVVQRMKTALASIKEELAKSDFSGAKLLTTKL